MNRKFKLNGSASDPASVYFHQQFHKDFLHKAQSSLHKRNLSCHKDNARELHSCELRRTFFTKRQQLED